VAELPLQSQEFKNIVQMEAEKPLSLRTPVGTFGQKRNGVLMGGQDKKKRSTMVNLISL